MPFLIEASSDIPPQPDTENWHFNMTDLVTIILNSRVPKWQPVTVQCQFQLSLSSSEMELQEEVNSGGLWVLRDAEEPGPGSGDGATREPGWNIEKECESEAGPLRRNMFI